MNRNIKFLSSFHDTLCITINYPEYFLFLLSYFMLFFLCDAFPKGVMFGMCGLEITLIEFIGGSKENNDRKKLL